MIINHLICGISVSRFHPCSRQSMSRYAMCLLSKLAPTRYWNHIYIILSRSSYLMHCCINNFICYDCEALWNSLFQRMNCRFPGLKVSPVLTSASFDLSRRSPERVRIPFPGSLRAPPPSNQRSSILKKVSSTHQMASPAKV